METIFREIKKELRFQREVRLDFAAHVHEDLELVYVKEGGGTAFCDGKRYTLTDGSFFLVFPNQVHRYIDCMQGEYIVLIMKPSVLLSYNEVFLEGAPASALLQLEDGADDGIISLLETALAEYERDGHSPIIGGYLTALFGKLLKGYIIEKSGLAKDTVLQVLQDCALHYKEPITVADIARRLRISRSCVSHIFSGRIAINFCEYINTLRLSAAVPLLESGNYSITEIAERAGFPTIRTFNRAFSKQYGMSPSAYRKSIKK